jgi:plastocyanin
MKRSRRLLQAVVLLLVALSAISARADRSPVTHVVTLTYDGTEVTVSPARLQLRVGDRIEYRSAEGEFALEFATPFSSVLVRSVNGVWKSSAVQNVGTYRYACTMVIDGQVISAEYGGEMEVAN